MELAILDQFILEREQTLAVLDAEIRLLASQPVRDIPGARALFARIEEKTREQNNHQIALDALRAVRVAVVATKGVSLPAAAVVA